MPAPYIAGFDGTEPSRAAVGFAADLAELAGSEAIVVNVYVFEPHVRGARSAGLDPGLGSEGRKRARELLSTIEDDRVKRTMVSAVSPAAGLHQFAADSGAAMIAVGVTHHGWLGRAIPGSMAHHLLHGAPCPVAVVPHAIRKPIRSIGVAFNPDPEAQEALDAAAELARTVDAEVTLIGAASNVPPMPPAEKMQQLIRSAAEQIPGAKTRVLPGSPGAALVEACKDDVDVLFMGSRQFGPARSVLLGSVSRYVVDHAPCAVVVVPRGTHVAPLGEQEEVAASA